MIDNETSASEYLAEALVYNRLKPNTILRTTLNLPVGTPVRKNVTVGLMSHDLNDMLDILSAKKIVNPMTNYRYVQSSIISQGTMLGRRYLVRQDKDALRKMITSHKFIWSTTAPKEDNVFVDCGTKLRTFERYSEMKPPNTLLNSLVGMLKDFVNVRPANDNTKLMMIFPINEYLFERNSAIANNKSNILYLIYYSILKARQTKPKEGVTTILDLDIDIILISDKYSMVFNPSKIDKTNFDKFRTAMFTLFKMNIDDMIKADKQFQDNNLDTVIPTTTVKKDFIPDTLKADIPKTPAKVSAMTTSSRPTMKRMVDDEEDVTDAEVGDIVQELPPEDMDDDTAPPAPSIDDVLPDNPLPETPPEEEIDIDEITPATRFNHRVFEVGSNKEKKVLEKQSKVTVNGKSIEDLTTVQGVDVPIETTEHNTNLHTSNTNMYESKFENYHLNYIEKVMPADMIKSLTALNTANTRFYVQDIQIDDTSDSLNYKETWKVKFIDEKSIIHNLVVDVPKIYEGKFMYIGGNYKVMNNQNIMKPLVKISATRAQLITNYNKITIDRHGTKSTVRIEAMFKLSSYDEFRKLFSYGDSKLTNSRYPSVLEYDEYARQYTRFKNKGCTIYFNREDKRLLEIQKNTDTSFTIGKENDEIININYETGLTQNGDSITDIIYRNLPDAAKAVYDKTKEGKRYLFTHCKLAGKYIPIAILLSYWETLEGFLTMANIQHRFEEGKRLISSEQHENAIKFSDGVLYYQAGINNELLMNGFKFFDTAHHTYQSMNMAETYNEYLHSVWADYRSINVLSSFKEFMVDPITLEVCQNLNMPTDISGLLIEGSHMLGSNGFLPESNDSLYRVRRDEVIPAILYKLVTAQYTRIRDTGGRQKLTLPRDALIKNVMALHTIEDYTALNPIVELEKDSAITAKGLSGLNDDGIYTEVKRLYSDSMIGKVGYTTSNDAQCGIVRTMSYEPTIANLRGMRDETIQDIHEYKDVNIFSAGELSTPGTCTHDDATRVGIN